MKQVTNVNMTPEMTNAWERALNEPVCVVRCKECKYYGGRVHGECGKWLEGGFVDGEPPPNWFCADGERK